MEGTHLRIGNMVCGRCIKVVNDVLRQHRLRGSVELGSVELQEPLTEEGYNALKAALEAEGFRLLDDKRSRLVSRIKDVLVELIHQGDLEAMRQNISAYLSGKLHKDYHYLSSLFSESENLTIEQFVIFQKIEKVKELLIYNELSLSEISYKMGYSSVAHLSAQFKKVTGFTPTRFKQLKDHSRRPIDRI
jgi:AraC-like DNA-binding protein